jgi:ribonuclease BN (tRNA processing enzyme)
MRVNRRDFISAAAAPLLARRIRPHRPAQRPRTRLILLGTGGGPAPKKAVSASAQVIVVNDAAYVVDCGDGVSRQLVAADVPLRNLRHIFITHHHSDHNADYGNLMLLSWASGLVTNVDTWGPPPLTKMTELFLALNAYDIDIRIRDEGRVPLAPLIRPHEITQGGLVMQDDKVKVTSTLVDHPLVTPAFAYRFDGPDRSIVISGDTARSDNLVKLARGADVLVHEALWLPAVDRIVARDQNARALKEHLLASHTAVEDCGRVAQAAGVKTLVLSHLAPGGDATITDELWMNAARQHFQGRIIVGKDLMEI